MVGDIAAFNGRDGVDVDEPTSTLSRNTAYNNGDLGIDAVAGVTDGGGNAAFGNGNPLQCIGLTCSAPRSGLVRILHVRQ